MGFPIPPGVAGGYSPKALRAFENTVSTGLFNNLCAESFGDSFEGMIERCNDGAGTAIFDEFHAGIDFGSHGAFEEVTGIGEFFHLCECDFFDIGFVWLFVIEFGVCDIGEDKEDVGVDELGEFGAGEVFVDDGGCADETVFGSDDWYTTATAGDDDDADIDQFPDDVDFGVVNRCGAGDDAAEAFGDFFGLHFFDDPVWLFDGQFGGFFFGKEGANGFGGILKTGIIGADDDLVDQRGNGRADAFCTKEIAECLFEHIAELPLCHGIVDIERHIGDEFFAFFLLDEEVADLRAVSVGDDESVTGFDEFDEFTTGLVDIGKLLFRSSFVVSLFNRISAECNEDCF